MILWLAVIIASLGCAGLKLAGFVVPSQFIDSKIARRVLEALPVTLLSALIALSTFASGNHLMLDSRAGGLAVALILVALRAPFLIVVVAACAAAAGVHALHPRTECSRLFARFRLKQGDEIPVCSGVSGYAGVALPGWCRQRLLIDQAAIAAARTMGARCSRSESWR